MVTFVNEDSFLRWYADNCRIPDGNTGRVLNDVYMGYCSTGVQQFVIPAAASVSGRDETYPFRFEDKGCCGASNPFIYF
ncbi:MAG: hypothetical protein IKQ73_08075 [Oscillospiraceae bacterium]|jgi:hypothetical protein|nr:hypothetical protein [Oscillospiraceae bacterium]MCR5174096.1 hypothetical protein [Oscillospiraceae bacterium]